MSTFKGFSQVELRKPTRSTFDLSHEKRLSTRMGKLTPVFVSETLPNDSFYGSTEVLLKLAPLLAPIFHRLNLYVHYFFVPYRLLWKDWETFITGGRLGEAVSVPPVAPHFQINQIDPANLALGSLADYLGIPLNQEPGTPFTNDRKIAAMPFLAYTKIWFDYYRDRNFVADTLEEQFPLPSGQSNLEDLMTIIHYRCWMHDYFTSALPWTQRGAEVLMPLAGTGSVTYLDQSNVFRSDDGLMADNLLLGNGDALDLDNFKLRVEKTGTGDNGVAGRIENIDTIDLDTSSVTINDLRRAVRLQEWLERNALAGSRYNESIMAHFGRRTSDGRLQRAEYIGGGKAVVQISEVMTTAYSEDADASVVPPGNMAGRGSVYSNTNSFKYNCEEHGIILGILSVMPTSGYMQGIPRMFTNRNTFLDYPWPTFAHLGEQEVYKSELWYSNATLEPDLGGRPLFGYQSRYADWKYIASSSHGDFRTTLDFWHLTRKFVTPPGLSDTFVTFEDELQDRVFAVSEVDTLWMYIYNNVKVKRSLPYFGTPQL